MLRHHLLTTTYINLLQCRYWTAPYVSFFCVRVTNQNYLKRATKMYSLRFIYVDSTRADPARFPGGWGSHFFKGRQKIAFKGAIKCL